MALSKSPAVVEGELETAARNAAGALAGSRRGQDGETRLEPFTFAAPLRFELRYQRADAAEAKARSDGRFSRIDAFTVIADGNSIRDFY
jgi:hypothetical protein